MVEVDDPARRGRGRTALLVATEIEAKETVEGDLGVGGSRPGGSASREGVSKPAACAKLTVYEKRTEAAAGGLDRPLGLGLGRGRPLCALEREPIGGRGREERWCVGWCAWEPA